MYFFLFPGGRGIAGEYFDQEKNDNCQLHHIFTVHTRWGSLNVNLTFNFISQLLLPSSYIKVTF